MGRSTGLTCVQKVKVYRCLSSGCRKRNAAICKEPHLAEGPALFDDVLQILSAQEIVFRNLSTCSCM